MVLTVTGIVLMIIASLLYYVTVQEIRRLNTMVRTSSDVENMNMEKIWKKFSYVDNDLSRTRLIAGNAAKQADEAIKKVNGISFGDYTPKHGKEDSE